MSNGVHRDVDVDVDVDVALVGCPAHEGQGCIAAMAALLGYTESLAPSYPTSSSARLAQLGRPRKP